MTADDELYQIMKKIWYGVLVSTLHLLLTGVPPGVSLCKFYVCRETMVRQNTTNKRVIAKIVFLKDLELKSEAPAVPRLFINSIYTV